MSVAYINHLTGSASQSYSLTETELNFKGTNNRMVATTDCTEESRPIAGKKVRRDIQYVVGVVV